MVRAIATWRCTLQHCAARATCGVCDGGGAAHRGRVPIRIGSLQQRANMEQRTVLQHVALLQRVATALAAARAEIDGVAKGIDHVVLSDAELKMFCTDLHFGEYR